MALVMTFPPESTMLSAVVSTMYNALLLFLNKYTIKLPAIGILPIKGVDVFITVLLTTPIVPLNGFPVSFLTIPFKDLFIP